MDFINGLLNAMGGPYCVLVALVILLVVPTLIGFAIIRPLSREAGRLRSPTKFLLSDFFWLVIQLQLALGYCVRFIGIENYRLFALIGGFLLLASIGLWAGAISILSRCNITIPSRRAVFIVILLPSTLFLMMAVSFVVLVQAVLAFDFATRDFRYGLSLMAANSRLGRNELLLALALLPLVCYGLRRCSFWVLSGRTTVEPAAALPAVNSTS